MTPKEIVEQYWQTMQSNDFSAAAEWLSEDIEIHWPQSNEIIRGRENFIAINSQYPSSGKWQFTLHSLVSDNDTVVTEVSVTDGNLSARAITFHTIINQRISKQIEYWPDPYSAPEWRAQWTIIDKSIGFN